MYVECSQAIPKKLRRPKSPIIYGEAATNSRVPRRACTREELPAGLLRHWSPEASQWNIEPLRREKEKRRRRSFLDKKCVRGDERRAAGRGASPSYSICDASRTSRARPSSSTINVTRATGEKIRTRKRAQVDPLASGEELLDAGSQISGVHNKYRRIRRTPAPPRRLHSRSSSPYPHSDLAGPFGYGRGSISGCPSVVTPAPPIQPGSENSRAYLCERSTPVFHDLASRVRSLLKWGRRLWSVYSNAQQRKQPTPFRVDITHAKNDGRELLEDLDMPCAPDTSFDVSWDERSDESLEEIEVEEELYSPLNVDPNRDLGGGHFDVEEVRKFWLQERVACDTLTGLIQPDWHFISPEPDDPLPLPPNRRVNVVSDDMKEGRHELPSTWAREAAQKLGEDGDLIISADLSSGRTLLSERKLPTWRQYRFSAVEHDGKGGAERKVPVRYWDEAAIEAQRLQAESDAGVLQIEWGGFDQEELCQCWS